MKSILIIVLLGSFLYAKYPVKYLSNSKIMAIYKGMIINPKCINGQSIENGVDTSCYVTTIGAGNLYFNKSNLKRMIDLSKNNQLHKVLVCEYQSKYQMHYNCKPMSEKNKKRYGYK